MRDEGSDPRGSEFLQKIMKIVLDNVPSLIYVSDFDTGEVLFVNERLRKLLGRADAEGKICWQTLHKGQDGPCPFCPKGRLRDAEGNPMKAHVWEYKCSIDEKWYTRADFAVPWIDGRYVHIQWAYDISGFKSKEEELRRKAHELDFAASTDVLTGIRNRQTGSLLLAEAYKRISRTKRPSTLCFMDLDGLKKVNDTYGHSEGDRVLVQFVSIVKEVIRKADIFCRWGGDEFVLLLEDCGLSQAEENIMRRVQKKIDVFNQSANWQNAALSGEERSCALSFSYGLQTMSSETLLSLEEVIALADQRMYESKMKKGGRGAE
ncbi:MAG: sensor domain-containing diguanylate cyclase [Synergistaceae bacterium]|jgi:diguanylate cyclase (GGDEF)-like protein|nr:sensor domain-containing diguanylate cyclase [Synergistaceae bacterium]